MVLVAWGVEYYYDGVQGKNRMPGWLKSNLAALLHLICFCIPGQLCFFATMIQQCPDFAFNLSFCLV